MRESRLDKPPKGKKRETPAEESAVIEKTLELESFLNECHKVIQEFDLVALVKKVKMAAGTHEEGKFNCVSGLSETERDCFCLGMVKLGEAMTFCKDSDIDAIKKFRNKNICGALCYVEKLYYSPLSV